MEIAKLPPEVVAKMRSAANVTTTTKCVLELVYNCLDAKATSVAVRVNLLNYKIQVADNGEGITKDNLAIVGQRYATNKWPDGERLKERVPKTFGFRGEALNSIVDLSESVKISSRSAASGESYRRILTSELRQKNREVACTKPRPSPGTTVTVLGWLAKMPVRQRMIVPEIELEDIKKHLERVLLITPQASFTLRNDATGMLLINSPKSASIFETFHRLHPEIEKKNSFNEYKVTKGVYSIRALVHKDWVLTKKYQYVYANKRPMTSAKIQQYVNKLCCSKNDDYDTTTKRYLVFVVSIRCPASCVDYSQSEVEFATWKHVLFCVHCVVERFLGVPIPDNDRQEEAIERVFTCGPSQVPGAVQGTAYKSRCVAQASGGNYAIEEFSEQQPQEDGRKSCKVVVKKEPLPIRLERAPLVRRNTPEAQLPDCPNDEERGKKLIMDMFLKSTRVFTSDSNEATANSSKETIEESNIMFERNVEDRARGVNATMSINVKVKRRKSRATAQRTVTSRAVQTSPRRWTREDSGAGDLANRLEEFTLGTDLRDAASKTRDNYTIVLRTVRSKRRYVFQKAAYRPMDNEDVADVRPSKVCKCNADGKLFRVAKEATQRPFEITATKTCRLTQDESLGCLGNIAPPVCVEKNKSPFQGTSNLMRESIEGISPVIFTTQTLQPGNNAFATDKSFGLQQSKHNPSMSKLPCPDLPHHLDSQLCLSLPSEQEKRRLINKQIAAYRHCETIFSCDTEKWVESRRVKGESSERSRVMIDSQNEWLRRVNDEGTRYFANRRTGMVSFATPFVRADDEFRFERRPDFVPKGMSQVLRGHKEVDRALSQNAKDQLQDFVLEGYQDELLTIKWQHFLGGDPKQFFEEIYKEKTKRYDRCGIPSLLDGKGPKNPIDFDRKMFDALKVIGQVDKKFIATLDESKGLIVLFDQHAVHERIRVEQLFDEYVGLKAACKQKLTFFLPHNELDLIKRSVRPLESVGLGLEFFTNGVHVTHVPLCIKEKFGEKDSACEGLNTVLTTLIKDMIQELQDNRGAFSDTAPRIVRNILNSKACRGAIKFGDALSKSECGRLLTDLSKCKLPFQCAHGRPTLTPIVTLDKIQTKVKTKQVTLNLLTKRKNTCKRNLIA